MYFVSFWYCGVCYREELSFSYFSFLHHSIILWRLLTRLFSVRFTYHYLNTGPFDNQAQIHHLKTRLVQYSNGYCTVKFHNGTENLQTAVFTFAAVGTRHEGFCTPAHLTRFDGFTFLLTFQYLRPQISICWNFMFHHFSAQIFKVQWGSESWPFGNQKHSKTGLFEDRYSSGGTIQKLDNLSSFHIVGTNMINHRCLRWFFWQPSLR